MSKRKTFDVEDVSDLNSKGNAHDRKNQSTAKPKSGVHATRRAEGTNSTKTKGIKLPAKSAEPGKES